MYAIAKRIVFPNKFLEFNHEENYIIVNPEICKSILLNKKEYETYSQIMQLKHESQDKCNDFIDSNEEAYKLIMRFLVSKVILLGNTVINKQLVKPDYYAAYWGLTEKCNFRCVYCYAKCGPEVKEEEDCYLDLEHCYRVVDEIAGIGFKILNLTGGEPLLNENVFKIARYAKGLGLKCGILTNGSLITEQNIKKFKIFDYVKVSLDSTIEEINDRTRGQGTYNKIIRGLNLLKKNNIDIMVGSVITKYNKDNVDEIINYVNEEYHAVSHSISNFISAGRAKEQDIGCSTEELKKVNEATFEAKRKIQKNSVGVIAQDVFLSDSKKTSCGMAMGEIFINYKADVFPCRMTYSPEYYLGNILKDGLKKSLDNADDLRMKFHVDHIEGCKECDYRYLCGGGCRMYHNGYTGSPDKNCPKVCEQYKKQIKNLLMVKHGIL